MASLDDYYGILNLEPGSPKAEIKQAYRILAQRWHPDKFAKHPDQQKMAREKFELIKAAYDHLMQYSAVETWDWRTQLSVRPPQAEKTPQAAQASSRSCDWQCVHTLSRHRDVVAGVAIAKGGKKLITASHDRTLRLWNLKTGSLLKTFSDHSQAIHCVAISWDGKLIASGSADKTIKIWDLRTGDLLRSFGNFLLGHTATVTALAFSPNHHFLASTSLDQTVRLWSLKSGKEIYVLKDAAAPMLALAIGGDGKAMVYGGQGRVLSMRHTKTGKPLRSFTIQGRSSQAVALGRQGTLLAAGSGTEIVMWNRHYQKKLLTLKGHTGTISALAFSADDQMLVSGSYDNTITLWHTQTGKPMATLTGHQAAVCAVAWGDNVIASGSADQTVKIWRRI